MRGLRCRRSLSRADGSSDGGPVPALRDPAGGEGRQRGLRRLGHPPVIGEILGGVVAGPRCWASTRSTRRQQCSRRSASSCCSSRSGSRPASRPAPGGAHSPAGRDPRRGAAVCRRLPGGGARRRRPAARGLPGRRPDGHERRRSPPACSASSRALRTQGGRIILGAAVIDDVLAIMILAVASGIAAGACRPAASHPGRGRRSCSWSWSCSVAPTPASGRAAHPDCTEVRRDAVHAGHARDARPRGARSCIGLAAIIGAFLAGMVVGSRASGRRSRPRSRPVAAFFTPFFFGFIGAQVDLAGLASARPCSCCSASRCWPWRRSSLARSSARSARASLGPPSSGGAWCRAGVRSASSSPGSASLPALSARRLLAGRRDGHPHHAPRAVPAGTGPPCGAHGGRGTAPPRRIGKGRLSRGGTERPIRRPP